MFIGLFLLWLILNGGVNLELVVFGLICSGLVYLFLWKVMGYSPRTDIQLLKLIPWAIAYILNLVLEVAKASREVMEVAFNPALRPEPVIVEFHSGLPTKFQNVLLANSITLTPGTITVFQEGDFFVVHCLRREYAREIEKSSFVRLLQKAHMGGMT